MNPIENKPTLNILIVDDEEIVHQTIAPYLRDSGHHVSTAYDGSAGLERLLRETYDLALVDVRMPALDGLSLLARVRENTIPVAIVIVSGHGDMEMVIQAIRLGAADFLTKPIRLLELDAVIEKSLRVRDLLARQQSLLATIGGIQSSVYNWSSEQRLIGRSAMMDEVRRQVRLAAEARCDTVLITGETGTGKEVVARELHLATRGSGSPFLPVSCPALPDTLVEGELFGHVKGSFTGATGDKAGCFELAGGGTIFLDEIADLSEAAQAKLLRALETRKIRRVGGAKEIDVDVNVVAATNAPLETLVDQGKFRRDLYFRLAVFKIAIPPLRERPDDVMPMAEHFLRAFTRGRGLQIDGFTREAEEQLFKYDYPGNARELRNVVERAAILCRKGRITPEHVTIPRIRPFESPRAPSALAPPAAGTPNELEEKQRILAALEVARWNRRDVARSLGLSYAALRYKIQKYGLC